MESSSLQELEQIPGVGKTIFEYLGALRRPLRGSIHSIDALKGRQAEQLCVAKIKSFI